MFVNCVWSRLNVKLFSVMLLFLTLTCKDVFHSDETQNDDEVYFCHKWNVSRQFILCSFANYSPLLTLSNKLPSINSTNQSLLAKHA